MPLTDTKLRQLKPTGRRFELPDRDGLCLRVTPKGTMTFTVAYRVRGKGDATGQRVARLAGRKQRLTLGEYPAVSLAQARAKAAAVKQLARSGTDPGIDQSDARRVNDLIDRYSAEHLSRNLRAGGNVEKLLRLHVAPAWGDRPLDAVTRADLVALLEKVRIRKNLRGGPGAASEVRKWVRAMFQFGVENSLLDANPFLSVRNRDRQRKRDRVLTMVELRAVYRAADRLGYPWAQMIQLLLLTGNRRGEWANAQWSWLDPDVTRLEIPAAHYKTERPQVVPLSAQARAIVLALPRHNQGPYIFSTDGGVRPVSGFSKARKRLTKELGDTPNSFVLHDLRRSMATHMERIGIEPHIIEVCLGHVLKGVAGVYRLYTYLPEKTEALKRFADEVDGEA